MFQSLHAILEATPDPRTRTRTAMAQVRRPTAPRSPKTGPKATGRPKWPGGGQQGLYGSHSCSACLRYGPRFQGPTRRPRAGPAEGSHGWLRRASGAGRPSDQEHSQEGPGVDGAVDCTNRKPWNVRRRSTPGPGRRASAGTATSGTRRSWNRKTAALRLGGRRVDLLEGPGGRKSHAPGAVVKCFG